MARRQPKESKEIVVPVSDLFTGKTAERIASTHTQELVIALCGPIGSPVHAVGEAIKGMLEDTFNYDSCTIIRLSKFIGDHAERVGVSIPKDKGFARINAQIEAGNKLRERNGTSILAELAINDIRLSREEFKEAHGASRHASRRVCHIIDSIKNQEEMELLRVVYREMVYFVGVFVPLDVREASLRAEGLSAGEVYQLIDRDSGEESSTGQTVRDTFPHCDFFLRVENGTDAQLIKRVDRFLNLVLGTRIITPTANEAAMYAAASAASNSACLSRQVGAAITDQNGDLLAIGWNDVPKFGGGLYLSDPTDSSGERDERCWNRDGGKCFNDEEKEVFADTLIKELEGLISEDQRSKARKLIRDSGKLRGLIEFSRSVHGFRVAALALACLMLCSCQREWYLTVVSVSEGKPEFCITAKAGCSGEGIQLESIVVSKVNNKGQIVATAWSIQGHSNDTQDYVLKKLVYGVVPHGWVQYTPPVPLVRGPFYSINGEYFFSLQEQGARVYSLAEFANRKDQTR